MMKNQTCSDWWGTNAYADLNQAKLSVDGLIITENYIFIIFDHDLIFRI